jgi:hypothetical protein
MVLFVIIFPSCYNHGFVIIDIVILEAPPRSAANPRVLVTRHGSVYLAR